MTFFANGVTVKNEPVVRTDSRELEIGKAAEHLVCADLILQGHKAFLADQGLSYNVVLDYKNKLWRVQVSIIASGEFDILALVALDIRIIAYIKISDKVLQAIHLREPKSLKLHANRRYHNIDEYPISALLEKLEERS